MVHRRTFGKAADTAIAAALPTKAFPQASRNSPIQGFAVDMALRGNTPLINQVDKLGWFHVPAQLGYYALVAIPSPTIAHRSLFYGISREQSTQAVFDHGVFDIATDLFWIKVATRRSLGLENNGGPVQVTGSIQLLFMADTVIICKDGKAIDYKKSREPFGCGKVPPAKLHTVDTKTFYHCTMFPGVGKPRLSVL